MGWKWRKCCYIYEDAAFEAALDQAEEKGKILYEERLRQEQEQRKTVFNRVTMK